MVRPVHSKRKLFNNAKEYKENTTPDEQLEQELPGSEHSRPGKCVCSKSLHSKASKQSCFEDNTHNQRPLPYISSEASSNTANFCSAGKGKQSLSGEDEGCVPGGVASTPSRPRHAMPMSERQQIALLMQMSSPSNSSKLGQDSNSPSPRCYSPYCDSSDPGTPQQQGTVSNNMVGGNSGTRAGGVSKRNERGETPLHVAAIRGDAERVQQLIARGSDVNAVDYAGWTALHEACNRGFVSVAVELINAGASVNAKGLDNDTPLHDACVNNHFKLVELLLDSGASTSIINRRGQTPADVCRSPVILSLLQKSAQDTSEILGNNIFGMSRRTPPSSAGKGPDVPKVEIKCEKDELADDSGDRTGSSLSSSQTSAVSSTCATSTLSSNSSNNGGRPSSPRVALRITSSGQVKTPDKRNSTDKEGRSACDDPYEFKCTKDEGANHGSKDGEGSSGQAQMQGKCDSATEERTEKRSIEEDEDETAKKRRRKEEIKDLSSGPSTKSTTKGEKGNKPTGRGSGLGSTTSPSLSIRNSGSGASNSSPVAAGGGTFSGGSGAHVPLDTNRKSPQSSSNCPKASIKVERTDETMDEDSSRSDVLSSSSNSSPKVPPLKIVLSACSSNSSSSNGSNGANSHNASSLNGLEQESAGPQSGGSGKTALGTSGGRHLPYVVASSASSSNSNSGLESSTGNCIKEEGNSSSQNSSVGGGIATGLTNQDSKDSFLHSVKEEPLSPGGCGDKSAARITRSQRCNADEGASGSTVKVEVKEEPTVTPSGCSSSSYSTLSASSSSVSHAGSSSGSTESVHPRKRKINIKEEESDPPSSSAPEQPLSNCYQMFLVIRKQIDDRRKLLFPVQPKPPQGFKDYLMNRATYVLASNPSSQQSVPMMSPPSSLPQSLKDIFNEQERDRYKLRLQHQIEREKMALSVEQEILRVHGRAAAALANQVLPFSACTILRDQEVYNILTPEQEEKHRNARSRYNGRLFISWLQDVDDKWEKIKESMVLRQQNEAESLHAVHRMDWEWKMKEVGLCDNKTQPVIEDLHVPMVAVSDFDLLPT